jgi:hypothetical protein
MFIGPVGLACTDHSGSEFAKPFEPPTKDQVLRFRYTTYMGELHPAEKKVVVEFCPKDLDLTSAQQLKLDKLAGARYNPEKDIIHMSCEQFEHQAQNKRYLGDLIGNMITEAKVIWQNNQDGRSCEELELTPPARTLPTCSRTFR